MMSAQTLGVVLTEFAAAMAVYFALWNVSQFLMGAISLRHLWRYQHRRTPRALALVARTATPPSVTIVVPARNEALTIVQNVRALLALDYAAAEIVVVNDGSTDDTLAVLTDAFALTPAPVASDAAISTATVRGVLRSIQAPTLVVIDKDAGGCKADAANAGINLASSTLVLVIDADTILDPEALRRAALPFIEEPSVVAVGGNVGIVNGSQVKDGRVTDVRMSTSRLARMQVIEYMRGFLLFRTATAALNSVSLISGAFGLFRRSAVIEIGGFDRTAIGEDFDLTVRLQMHFRRKRLPIRITFVPFTVCWTQAPEDWPSLRAQRLRWRRGLLQTLWRHRGATFNPRMGLLGTVVLPYVALFEGIGPLLEVTGVALTLAGALLGLVDWFHFRVLMAVAVLFGFGTTLFAVFLNDLHGYRHSRSYDLFLILRTAVIEHFGYRQVNAWWAFTGTFRSLFGRSNWGPMRRRTF